MLEGKGDVPGFQAEVCVGASRADQTVLQGFKHGQRDHNECHAQ